VDGAPQLQTGRAIQFCVCGGGRERLLTRMAFMLMPARGSVPAAPGTFFGLDSTIGIAKQDVSANAFLQAVASLDFTGRANQGGPRWALAQCHAGRAKRKSVQPLYGARPRLVFARYQHQAGTKNRALSFAGFSHSLCMTALVDFAPSLALNASLGSPTLPSCPLLVEQRHARHRPQPAQR
jgi:hypothetical protein